MNAITEREFARAEEFVSEKSAGFGFRVAFTGHMKQRAAGERLKSLKPDAEYFTMLFAALLENHGKDIARLPVCSHGNIQDADRGIRLPFSYQKSRDGRPALVIKSIMPSRNMPGDGIVFAVGRRENHPPAFSREDFRKAQERAARMFRDFRIQIVFSGAFKHSLSRIWEGRRERPGGFLDEMLGAFKDGHGRRMEEWDGGFQGAIADRETGISMPFIVKDHKHHRNLVLAGAMPSSKFMLRGDQEEFPIRKSP